MWSGLAGWTPVGGAVGVALAPGFDRCAAAAAAAAGAVVDDPAFAAGLDRGGHQLVRGLKNGAKLVLGGVADGAPRRDARLPERLRLPDASDPGHEPLVRAPGAAALWGRRGAGGRVCPAPGGWGVAPSPRSPRSTCGRGGARAGEPLWGPGVGLPGGRRNSVSGGGGGGPRGGGFGHCSSR